MARKSREVRLAQTQDLIEKYESAGLSSDKSCRFMRDMEYRLAAGKGLTTRQRSWLDRLIDEGVPSPKNPELVAQLLEAANLEGMQSKKSVLIDFAGKVRKGWKLSEKQTSWMNKMLAEAEDIRVNGVWTPSDDLKNTLEMCLRIASKQSSWYWSHRPSSSKAYSRVHAYMNGESDHIDMWTCNKFTSCFSKALKEINTPKHSEGDMRYVATRTGKEVGIVTGSPFISDQGVLCYPMLVSGTMKDTPTDQIYKRR